MKICYFGIYDPNLSRNKVYIDGLRQNGVDVIKCVSREPGLLKYFLLIRKHWQIRKDYDVMIVGFPGRTVILLARFLTRKPIIFDAQCSAYEAEILSRRPEMVGSLWALRLQFVDWSGFLVADKIMVESEEQCIYLAQKYHIRRDKFVRVFTGLDIEKFSKPAEVKKNDKYTVLFRGRLMHEAGVEYIIKAAKILEKEDIEFIIIGFGDKQKEVERQLDELNLKNITYIDRHISDEDLTRLMKQSHISLGQFADHERRLRTIPHKAFESLFLGLPYITAEAPAIKEIIEDGVNGLFVRAAAPDDLAVKILELKNDPSQMRHLAEVGLRTYQEKFATEVLGQQMLSIISDVLKK